MLNEMFSPYKKQPVKFLGFYCCDELIVKIYSITASKNEIDKDAVDVAKRNIKTWLENKSGFPQVNYNLATLILHQAKEGIFAIISCWLNQNMLQLHAYLADIENPSDYKLISDKGIVTCV